MALPSTRSRVTVLIITASAITASSLTALPAHAATAVAFSSVIPAPVTATPAAGVTYPVTTATTVYTEPGSAAATTIGTQLATTLRRSTGYPIPVTPNAGP